jgi:hypothetical protein
MNEPAPPPAPAGPERIAYAGPEDVARLLAAMAAKGSAKVETYGTSAGGRPLLVLRVGRADLPQVLVHGGVGDRDAAGTAAALEVAQRLVEGPEAGKSNPLDRVGFLVIPAPNPDALAAFLTGKGVRGGGSWDRDRDGQAGEDGPRDVDGDGEILWMRRKTPTGTYAPDVAAAKADGKVMGDPRAMKDGGVDVRREASYEKPVPEAGDTDGDGEVGEDPPGLDLTRQFCGTWDEPGPWPGEGPFPAFAPEVKALMDLSYETTRLVAWYGFASEGPRIERPSERGKDADVDDALYGKVAEAWKAASGLETRKASERPGGSGNPGSDLDWASKHLGCLAARVPVWRIDKQEKNGRERADPDEVDWLLWDDARGGKGFVPWHEVPHPRWGTVEVGGWRRFTRWEPPADLLPAAVRKVVGVPIAHAEFAPRLDVVVEVEAAGTGTWRVKARATDPGGGPTDAPSSERARRATGVRVSFRPAAGVEVLGGPPVAAVGIVAAGGASGWTTWIVRRWGAGALGTARAGHRVAGAASKEVATP